MAKKSKKEANVPNLRFPEFDENWEQVYLGDICKMQAGKFVAASEINEKQTGSLFPCYGGNGLRGYTKTFNQEGKYSLIGRQGALCGNVTLVSGKFHATEHAVVVTPNDCVNNDWMYYLLIHLNLNQYATGMAQPGLSVQNLEKVEAAIPKSQEEQRKIAVFLSLLDERIRTQNKIIDELESSIKKMIDDMFSQRIRFPGFQDSWVRTTVEKQCLINPRTEKVASEFVYIDLELVEKGELMRTVILQRSEAPSRASRVLEDGDILFQCVRPYQQNNYLYWKRDDKQWVASTGYAQIRTNNNPVFIYYLLHQTEFNNEVMMRCSGTSYPSISGNELGKIPISICSHDEQNKIANLLSTLDEKIRTEKSMLQRLKIQKKYLLHSLFDFVA